MNFHQDWEPVVFRNKSRDLGKASALDKSVLLDNRPRKPSGPTHAQKLDQNTENYKDHKKIPKVLADAIKQKRIDMKITQEDLAKKVNVRSGLVNDIESQRCVYDPVTIEKIKRVLGITNKTLAKN